MQPLNEAEVAEIRRDVPFAYVQRLCETTMAAWKERDEAIDKAVRDYTLIAKQLARIAELERLANEFRDDVLHSRHEMAETVEDSDQVNAILSAFDRTIGTTLAAVPPKREE